MLTKQEIIQKYLQEKRTDIDNIQKRISTLSHQVEYFNQMQKSFQEQVINDLIDDMIEYGIRWENAKNELKEELEKLK